MLFSFFLQSEHVCLVNGNETISVTIIPDTQDRVHFNVLFVRLYNMLSKSQAMSLYEVNPAKLLASALLEGTFPAIKATDNLPTLFVSPRTVAYIYTLIVDSVTRIDQHASSSK